MYSVRSIPHTADVCLQLESDSPEELFMAGLEGMNQILTGTSDLPQASAGKQIHPIMVESVDRTALLIDFLSELLTLTLSNKRIYHIQSICLVSDRQLQCSLTSIGFPHFEDDIKAVTYHSADVIQTQDGKWKTDVVFDI